MPIDETRCRELFESGAPVDEVLRVMRDEGASRIESMFALVKWREMKLACILVQPGQTSERALISFTKTWPESLKPCLSTRSRATNDTLRAFHGFTYPTGQDRL